MRFMDSSVVSVSGWSGRSTGSGECDAAVAALAGRRVAGERGDVVRARAVRDLPLDLERAARGVGRTGAGEDAPAVVGDRHRPVLAVAVRVDLDLDLDPAVVVLGLELPHGGRRAVAGPADLAVVAALGLCCTGATADEGEGEQP